MSTLQQIFETTAGTDADAVLSTPDLRYVVQLLRCAGETFCVDDLEQLYAGEGWSPDRSFTCPELQTLQDKLHAAAQPAAADDTTARERPHAAAEQISMATDDVLAVDPIEDDAAPADLPRNQRPPPSAALHPFPVEIGDVGVEEQNRRQELLARALPEDMLRTESLMEAEYANLVQGQPALLRSCFPPTTPPAFRATRYFSTLETAMQQREE